MTELCQGHPAEFKEYMEYCRALKFEQEPNYKTVLNLFESCMSRHNLDPKIMHYTWKQNRLSKDKEALKNSVLNVIRKKPKNNEDNRGGTMKAIGGPAGDQGYSAAKKDPAMGG